MFEVIDATDLIIQLGIHYQVEVVVNFLDLSEVLVLHAAARLALLTVLSGVGEQDLIDHDVVDVDLLLGQLDSETLSLVHAQELGDANCHECSLVGVLELLAHLFNLCLHFVHAVEHAILSVLSVLSFLVHHSLHLSEHAPKLVFQVDHLNEAFLQDVREVEEPEGMSSRRRVKDNH